MHSHQIDPARGYRASGQPLLSVVIPTHDVEPWIDELLGSVLATTFPEMEVIVVDDHSTDGTLERLADLAAVDPRVYVVSTHERGGAGARNVGLALARGEYVAFADGDDIVPPGSYERLVSSLQRSGSDIAFGDWLKFSSTRTWQPSRNWRVFDEDRIGIQLTDAPALVRGRAVWNKVFRRSFLVEAGIAFPEVPRSNDIVPMTRAYLGARAIDVLADCVYLYRDRPGTGSMTSQAGASAAARSYFTQEAACAALVAERGDDGLSTTYSALVFDADSWLHLSRLLREVPVEDVRRSGALESIAALVENAPRRALGRATPHKQLLWFLVTAGHLDTAERFNRLEEQARAADRYDAETFTAWIEALQLALREPDVLREVRRDRLVVDGLATLLLHHARDVSGAEADAVVSRIRLAGLADRIDPDQVRTEAVRPVVRALRDGDGGTIRLLSVSRDARLVVDRAELDGVEVVLGGPLPEPDLDSRPVLILRSGAGDVVRVAVVVTDDRWAAVVPSNAVDVGRWEVAAEFSRDGAVVRFPVVTARMPLPIAARPDRFRVLADRKRGWRVLLERRPSTARRAVARLVRRR